MTHVGARQVDGARVGVEAFCDQIHDVPERFVEIVGSRDDLSDVRQ